MQKRIFSVAILFAMLIGTQISNAQDMKENVKKPEITNAAKAYHVTEAADATSIILSEEEINSLEKIADNSGVDTRGSWEAPMC